MFVDDFSLPLSPPLTNSTDGCAFGQLLTFILSFLLLFLLTLFTHFCTLSPPSKYLISLLSFLFFFFTRSLLFSFSLPFLSLGHIHLLIVMIAARSSAMACRKSELVHVSEHRYALWTPAGSFTDCWSEEGDDCLHELQNKAPNELRGNDAANKTLQYGTWRRLTLKNCPKTTY